MTPPTEMLTEMEIKKIDEEIDPYFHGVEDGEFCWGDKKPLYEEDTGGKRIVGFETGKCFCGGEDKKKEVIKILRKWMDKAEKAVEKNIYLGEIDGVKITGDLESIKKMGLLKAAYLEGEKAGVEKAFQEVNWLHYAEVINNEQLEKIRQRLLDITNNKSK